MPQAAVQGGALAYASASSFGAAAGSPGASQYLSRRTASGWVIENLTVPQLSGAYDTAPGAGTPYRLFAADLTRGLLSNGQRCRGEAGACPVANPPLPGSGAPAGYRNYYLRDERGGFNALLDGGQLGALDPAEFEVSFVAASPDLRQLVLSSCAALTADAAEVAAPGGGCEEDEQNLYLWSAAGVRALNLLPGDTATTPGATVAAAAAAVSADGARVYWGRGGELYLREAGNSMRLDRGLGGEARFQVASDDGGRAYFTEAGHLFSFDAGDMSVTDVTPAGGALGVLGASADGTVVYYLTGDGLFLSRGGASTPIASGADAAAPGDYPPATGTARVSADGSRLLFLSAASLTGYENEGQPQVFLYGPPAAGGAARLRCLSCNPRGSRPLGPSTIPGAFANGTALRAYKPRVLVAGGSRVFFDSADALVAEDTNAAPDVYQWEDQGVGSCRAAGGCLDLISSGRSEGGASFIDASADGADAFFLTGGSLVPEDPGASDLYDARVGGGFSVSAPPIPCFGDACQPIPAEPEDPTPGTMFLRPEGNPPLSFAPGGAAGKAKGKKPGKRHVGKRKAGKRGGKAKGGKRKRGARRRERGRGR